MSRAKRRRLEKTGAQSPPPRATRFYGALEGWRGICAVLVALYHFRAPGAMGVLTNSHITETATIASAYLFTDFFFVLSGFVMAANYGERLARAGGVRRFIAFRFARIWPLHAVTLVAVLAVLLMSQWAAELHLGRHNDTLVGPMGGMAFLVNAVLLQAWHVLPWLSWNRPSWSISAEMVAYLMFAVGMRLARPVRLAAVVLILGLVPWLIVRAKGTMDVTFDWGVPRVLFGFVIGTMTFALHQRTEARMARWSVAWGTLVEAAVALLAFVFVARYGDSAWSVLAPLIFAVTLLVFSAERGLLGQLLCRAPFSQLGAWSYSIYMLHYPLQLAYMQGAQIFRESILGHTLVRVTVGGASVRMVGETPWMGDALAILMLVVLVGASALTYRYIEQPPRRWMRARFAGARNS